MNKKGMQFFSIGMAALFATAALAQQDFSKVEMLYGNMKK